MSLVPRLQTIVDSGGLPASTSTKTGASSFDLGNVYTSTFTGKAVVAVVVVTGHQWRCGGHHGRDAAAVDLSPFAGLNKAASCGAGAMSHCLMAGRWSCGVLKGPRA